MRVPTYQQVARSLKARDEAAGAAEALITRRLVHDVKKRHPTATDIRLRNEDGTGIMRVDYVALADGTKVYLDPYDDLDTILVNNIIPDDTEEYRDISLTSALPADLREE